ncbi:hypothetical protein [Parerythrobacter lacustris]|uniref:CHAP domain-containing protein n=1 Tax=Parerythrobacter lacustris TaxID=2969984 RepID=A0ABT1XQF6_9SPHN|nr:hypothetical protein [Parerythrobacter lacustris]MCR2833467.1 hypothetical protein [Parerythrobacter lacustris]
MIIYIAALLAIFVPLLLALKTPRKPTEPSPQPRETGVKPPSLPPATPEPVTIPESEVVASEPKPIPPSPREVLYQVAFTSLGRRMGLDTNIPKEVNCANAITHVMTLAGVKGLPGKGIPGTSTLYDWLRKSVEFEKAAAPQFGDIIIYPTGMGNGEVRNGHVFIAGKHQLMSNNSATGRWDNHWENLAEADAFYTKKGGIPRFCFRWIGG